MTFHTFIQFLVHYKYIAIFPIAIIEGPIVSIIGGFLISRGVFAFLPTFLVVFLGDAISDSFFYYLGRGGRRFIHIFHISEERIARIESQYEKSPWKTMILAKVSYGLGIVFMTASGVAKMSFKRFMYYMMTLNAVRSLILLAIGYYFGKLAIRSGQQYLNYYVIGMCILVPLVYIIVKVSKKRNI